jgi:hypothetical protein
VASYATPALLQGRITLLIGVHEPFSILDSEIGVLVDHRSAGRYNIAAKLLYQVHLIKILIERGLTAESNPPDQNPVAAHHRHTSPSDRDPASHY